MQTGGRRGARRAAALLALPLLLAACATPRPAPSAAAPITASQAVELAQRWAAEWEGFQGMRGAIDLTVKNRRESQRVSALLMASPTALRVDVMTPFGLPALVATAGPDDITIFRVLERRAQTARPSPEAVERWLGVPVAPATLLRLLVGNVPPPADPRVVDVADTPSPHLVWTEGGIRHRVWVTGEGRPVRLLLEAPGGADRLAVEYEWSGAGGLVGVRLEAPERGAEVIVRYLSAEYIENPPDSFRLALPSDIPVQQLD